MNVLKEFMNTLCGNFNNEKQIKDELAEGLTPHPKARHINAVCNDKIKNLPADFDGYFIIEESFYQTGAFEKASPHLFLFTLNEDGNVLLTSYDIPSEIKKEDFRNDNDSLMMDYNTLKKSAKFTPMVYTEDNGVFQGESTSHFSETITFILKEKFEKDTLYVSEMFFNGDKMTFGFPDPIIYRRITE